MTECVVTLVLGAFSASQLYDMINAQDEWQSHVLGVRDGIIDNDPEAGERVVICETAIKIIVEHLLWRGYSNWQIRKQKDMGY